MTVNEERVTENHWAKSRQGLPSSLLLIHKVLPGSEINKLHVFFWLSANRISEFLTLPSSNLPQNEIHMELILGVLVPDQIDTCTL